MAENGLYPMQQPMGANMGAPPYPSASMYTPGQYNPYMVGQQRMQQIEQMYPDIASRYMQPSQQPQQAVQPAQQTNPQQVTSFSGRAVNGIEEAKQANMVFDGSVNIFTDIGAGKIYTRQLMLDGTVATNTYALQPAQKPQEAAAVTAVVPVQDDISKAIESATGALAAKVNQLEQKLNTYEGMFLNGLQSNADHGDAPKQRKPNANPTGDSGK